MRSVHAGEVNRWNHFNRYFGFLAWQMLGNLFHFLGRRAGLNFVIRLLNVSAQYQLQEGIFADDLHKKVDD